MIDFTLIISGLAGVGVGATVAYLLQGQVDKPALADPDDSPWPDLVLIQGLGTVEIREYGRAPHAVDRLPGESMEDWSERIREAADKIQTRIRARIEKLRREQRETREAVRLAMKQGRGGRGRGRRSK